MKLGILVPYNLLNDLRCGAHFPEAMPQVKPLKYTRKMYLKNKFLSFITLGGTFKRKWTPWSCGASNPISSRFQRIKIQTIGLTGRNMWNLFHNFSSIPRSPETRLKVNKKKPWFKHSKMSKRKFMYGSIFVCSNRVSLSLPVLFLENRSMDEKLWKTLQAFPWGETYRLNHHTSEFAS